MIIAQLHIDDMKSPIITNLTIGSALKNKEKWIDRMLHFEQDLQHLQLGFP